MTILSWLRGKKKQREMRKLEPDKDFEFETRYYGDSNIIEGFNFVYCNNYTNKFCTNKDYLSYISCVISLPVEEKVLEDLTDFLNHMYIIKFKSAFSYNNIYVDIKNKNVKLYLRGNLNFYQKICDNIHNNIFAKYIRNNLFINDVSIETPNEFLDKMYNSINNPCKDVDILFIEDNIICEGFKPVIGLSIKKSLYKEETIYPYYVIENDRAIVQIQLNEINDRSLNYLINDVKHGNKLIELLHITNNDYLDIDEVIE